MKNFIVTLGTLIIFLLSGPTFNLRGQDTNIYTDEDVEKLPLYDQAISYTVQGTIKNASNNPVSNVHVMLIGNNNFVTTYTDSNGHYQFNNVVGGHYYTISPNSYLYIPMLDNSQISGTQIVTIASNELGNTDGPPPGRYHGHGGGWCSEFVSWVYWQAGDPFVGGKDDGGVCIQDWNMSTGDRVVAGFGRNEKWQFLSIDVINSNWQDGDENPLEPQAGDYVLFSNTSGIDRSHSGLIDNILGNDMYTVEGNVSDEVKALIRQDWRTYQTGDTVVKGIGYRRIVSKVTFDPRFYYFYLNSNKVEDFQYVLRLTLFLDVPSDHWAYDAINAIYNAGITTGCSQTPLKFCPDVVTNREQMAVFLGRGVHGSEFTPPDATGIFADVDLNHWAADWIEQAYNDGITVGCGTNPLKYCPTVEVTRAQMAAFLLRAIHGGSYTPPAATGIFSDVDLNNWAAPWIEQLYNEGITVGCGTNPLRYCPDASVTRAQMAVFLMRAFGL